ncbi:hypothetical protein BKA70DRAFT_1309369 [Coprinopsis sp. MPI-PUGE-AT-0042]|nr:hypothetical protein BKA70DRAFT_1309369 [Coprinopsis sp. MPI-PUGE-AT-0042]
MSDNPLPPGVVLFDSTVPNPWDFSAAGRDHINLEIHLGGAGSHLSATPLIPKRAETPLLTRVYRRFRRRSERRPRTVVQEPGGVSTTMVQNAEWNQPPRRPPPSPDADSSSLTSLENCWGQSPPARRVFSSEEEVYERSLLSKRYGLPLYNPQPTGKPIRFGDFGILGQDGFESFGNVFDPDDQHEFSLSIPPQYDARRYPRKLQEGQVVASGIEDARTLTDGDQNTRGRFEFRSGTTQGAVLALTSSGELESLTPDSRNRLREYLCTHGLQLVINLRRKYYLQPGESLYVVTGTIKSDSWAIAVHTSPMREPYDHMVLSRREGYPGLNVPTHEWTSCGSADARYGESNAIGEDGGRAKDQCLFLRGFLLTPSAKLEQQSMQGPDSGSDTANFSPSSGSPHSRETGHTGGKGDDTSGTRQATSGSDHSAPSSGSCPQHQLRDPFETRGLVQPFLSRTEDYNYYHNNYYPSRCLNDMLLADEKNVELAITHDDIRAINRTR